jgi:hypothetical protein
MYSVRSEKLPSGKVRSEFKGERRPEDSTREREKREEREE